MKLLSLDIKAWLGQGKVRAKLPVAATLVDILEAHAQENPRQIAYRFLENGEEETATLTYGELAQKARVIAQALKQRGAESQARALLLYPSGLDFLVAFWGCLYAGIIAVPTTLPRRREKASRLGAIAADCQAQFLLTTQILEKELLNHLEENALFASMQWLATDRLVRQPVGSWSPPQLTGETIAFLQYTSGSTGNPKGVIVTHQSILYNQEMLKQAFDHPREKAAYVTWLPLFHDMGLIGNILQALYAKIPCIFMPPEAFMLKPVRWLQAISRYQATTSGAPNFAYDLLNEIPGEQLVGIDLRSWEIAFCGAEPIRSQTMEKFSEKYRTYGLRPQAFYPCYGMAEATLFVSGGSKNVPARIHHLEANALKQNQAVLSHTSGTEVQSIVSCGHTWLGQKILIVNPETLNECAEQQIGEIWLSGENICSGYWQNPMATEQTFHARIPTSTQTFLRTGDLGYLCNGELFVTGRLKDLIIIRGRNYYPQDLELTAEQSHPALRHNAGAAFWVEQAESGELVIAQEVKRTYVRKLHPEEIINAVRLAVSRQHNLQVDRVLLLKTGTIPKTSSGKIQRSACRLAYLAGHLTCLAA